MRSVPELEDRIRIRAYFKWLARPDKSLPSELDDWLTAESEEQVLGLIDAAGQTPLREPSFTQDEIWYAGDQLAELFRLLKNHLRKRRARSYLLSLIDSYQDYLTTAAALSDEEAVIQGTNAFHILRLIGSLRALVGHDFMRTAAHTASKELKDLFSEDRTAFETAEFNLYSAAAIQRQSGLPVSFIDEGDEISPDLQVDDVAYVECKDIHTLSRGNIEKTLADNLATAHEQLAAAQLRRPLLGSGVCIDIPWGTLPLAREEWDVIRTALSAPGAPQFILVSCSGIDRRQDAVGFPVAVCLVWSNSGAPLFEPLLRQLTRASFRMQPYGYDEITH